MRVGDYEHQLTNIEVFNQVNIAKSSTRSENLQTIVVELQAYLRERPAGNPNMPQTEDKIKQFLKEMERYKLENSELLQIVNSAPNSLPVMFCLIEEADDRFSEADLEHMVELSGRYLGEEVVPGEPAE